MKELVFAERLPLPISAVTQTFAFLGRRGSGKTYACGKLVEEMISAGAQVVILDPVGNWYGLRLAADGKAPGISIPVFGGEHGDLPLEPTAGALVADLVVDRGISLVLDVSGFRKAGRRQFMTDFAEQLFHRKKTSRSAVHLVIEEAQVFVPQRSMKGELGAMEDLVKLGRNYGIGVSLLSQRPQAVHKDALNQSEVLVLLQLTGPHERKAVEAWVEDHGLDGEGKVGQAIEELPRLPTGEAWVWSPQFLGVLRRVRVGAKWTYDASATPQLGKTTARSQKLAEVDLEAIRCAMAETVQQAQKNDPKALRKRIAELERKLADAEARPATVKQVEVPVLRNDQLERLAAALQDLRGISEEIARTLAPLRTREQAPQPASPNWLREKRVFLEKKGRKFRAEIGGTSAGLTGPEQRILDALAWLASIGLEQPTQHAVAFLAGYTIGGGAYTNPRGRLHQRGLIAYRENARLSLTEEGRSLANTPTAPLTAAELQTRVLERLPGPEQRLLRVVLAAYPDPISNEDLAARAGYQPHGGAYTNPRGRLRSLGLIDYPRPGLVVAAPLLFLA